MTDADLVARAERAASRAYAPYSRFRVGAVVVAEDGSVFDGANVENAAYPSTLCAEAVAIGTAVAAGARRLPVVAVACLDSTHCAPCGNCRQLMVEFGVERVVVPGEEGSPVSIPFGDLLPRAFGPEALPD